MTREEAIQNIKEHCYFANLVPPAKEALDMAIKALEQEPCEDAVSRQAVLNEKCLIELEDGQSFYCISPEDVEALPPVTPTRKKGNWIHGHCGVDDYIRCSECGREVVQNIVTLEGDVPEYAFTLCPFCGADMRDSNVSENPTGSD